MEQIPLVQIRVDDNGDIQKYVQSIGDLKANIKAYKDTLNELEIGSEKYDNTLKALQINQAALKGAMHATSVEGQEQSVSMEQVSKAAYGAGNSYNALVKRMAELDQAFRSTEDASERAALGKKIKEVNDQLKDLDAQRGKFQRNVGNYKSALDGVGTSFSVMGAGARGMVAPLGAVKKGFDALKAHPIIGALGLIVSALSAVVKGMKSSEENTNSWNRALSAFKPIIDGFTRGMQAVGKAVADVANWIVDLLDKWGMLNEASAQRTALELDSQRLREYERGILLENANLEEEVARLRAQTQEKEKYTAKERMNFLKEAQKWEKKIVQNNLAVANERLRIAQEEAKLTGNDIETNDRLVQLQVAVIQARTAYNQKMRSLNREMNTTTRELAKTTTDAVKEETDAIEEGINALITWNTLLERMRAGDAQREEDRKKAEEERIAEEKRVADLWAEVGNAIEEGNANLTDSIQTELDAQLDAFNTQYAAEADLALKEKELFDQRLRFAASYVGGVSNLFSAIADIYEANGDEDEKSAQKAKALRTASAIINTISGAVSAYMNTIESIPNPVISIPLAAINAASVLASGYAQVKQINSVKVGNSSGAVVSAPAFTPAIANVRSVTGKTEEERLNRMASENRVYLVYSDIEVAQSSQRVKVKETEF